MDVLVEQLRRRDSVQRDSVAEIVADYGALLERHNALQAQCAQQEQRITILKYEASRSGKGPGAASDGADGIDEAEARKLRAKVMQLQEELTESLRAANAGKEERLRLSREARDAHNKLTEAEASLKLCEEQLSASMAQAADLKAALAEQTSKAEILAKELSAARGDGSGDELARLRTENETLVSRMLDEKMRAAEQINKMNDDIDLLRKKLASVAQGGGGGGQAAGRRPSGAAGGAGGRASSASITSLDGMSPATTSSGIPTVAAQVVRAHSTEINDVALNDGGEFVMTASSDGTVKVWETMSGKPRATLRGTSQPVMCVDTVGSLVAGGCNDRICRIWDVGSERIRKTLGGHAGKIYSVRFRPDGRSLVTTGTDRKVKVWDLHTGNCVRTISCTSIINSVDVSPDGGTVVTGHQDGGVRLWDLGSGARVAENRAIHAAAVTSVAFSHGGGARKLLTASRDNTLRLLDSHTLVDIDAPVLRESSFRVAFNWAHADLNPGGAYAVGGSSDGRVLVWDTHSGEVEQILEEHSASVSSLRWSADGRTIASTDKGGTLVLWR